MKRSVISRRAFIRLALLGGIGAGLAVFQKLTSPIHPVSYIRWKTRGLAKQYFRKPSYVSLTGCADYQAELPGALEQAWDLAEMPEVRGLNILVKPNLVDTVRETASTTAPEFIAAMCDVLINHGASSVIVGDGPAFRRDVFSVARQIGLSPLLEQRNVPLLDLNYDDLVLVKSKDGWFPGEDTVWLPRHALEADLIISVAKLKTHHWAGVSLSMKNLLGIFPGAVYGWPKNFIHFNGIPQTICGIYQLLPKTVGVIDGIVGMQGDGPLFGTKVEHGVIASSQDLVALDMVCRDLMSFQEHSVDYLDLAVWAGIGQGNRIQIRGGSIEKFRREYKRPPTI